MRRSTLLGVLLAFGVGFSSGCSKKPAEPSSTPIGDTYAVPAVLTPDTVAADTKNLKTISTALFDHHDNNFKFPAAAIVEPKTGRRLLSWRVAILPFLGNKELHARFKFDEPWDSENNKKLVAEMPAVYATPGAAGAGGLTHYRVFVGKAPYWDWSKGISLPQIMEGSSNTGAVFVTTQGVPWTQPDEPSADAKTLPVEALRFTDGKSPVLYYDGAVHLLDRNALVTAFTAGWAEASRGKVYVNTFKPPTAYLTDPDAIAKVPAAPSVTIDGVVIAWPDATPAPGDRVRYVRLASLKKVTGGPDALYHFDCELPEGSREFEGVRLNHVVRVKGGVARRSITPSGPIAERVVLRDCKLVSVSNGSFPPSPSALEAAKALQGRWRVVAREGSKLTPAQLGSFEIRVTDFCMTWTIAINKTSNAVSTFGLDLEPGGARGAVDLHLPALHMVPALYEVKGDTLRLCLQFPLNEFRTDTERPATLAPAPGIDVIVAERVK